MKAMTLNPESFLKVMELMLTTHDIDDMLTNVVEEVRDFLDTERCALFIIDKPSDVLFSKVWQKCGVVDVKLPLSKKSIEGHCALTGREISVKDAYNDKELQAIDPELCFDTTLDEKCTLRTKNLLCVPIMAHGETIGVFEAFNKPGGFIERNLEAVREFAFLLGIALYNAMTVAELKRVNEELKKCQTLNQCKINA